MSSPPSVLRTETPEARMRVADYTIASEAPPSREQLSRWLNDRNSELAEARAKIAALEKDNDLLRSSLESSRDGWRRALAAAHDAMFRAKPAEGEMYVVVSSFATVAKGYGRAWAMFASLDEAVEMVRHLKTKPTTLDAYVARVSR